MPVKQFTHIILMGMKHTGKSTLGTLLARNLGIPFHDTDTAILRRCGKSPRALFDEGGEFLMMEQETAACRELVAGEASVIATGGGLADNADALEILGTNGLMVFIDTPFSILFARILESAEKDGRLPKFLQGEHPERLFQEIFARRTEIYAKMADVTVSAGARTPPDIATDIMDYIRNE